MATMRRHNHGTKMNCLASQARFLLLPLLILLLPVPVPLNSQTPPKEEKEYQLRVPVSEVVVPVTVEDGDGRPVYNLLKENFALYEDSLPQIINRFSIDPAPLSAAILIDSSTGILAQSLIKDNLGVIVESLSQFDEASIYEFEHVPDLIQEFTSDKDVLMKSFAKITLAANPPAFEASDHSPFSNTPVINGIPIGTGMNTTQPNKTINTHIDDAIFAAAQSLRNRSKDRRKIIFVISNGQNAPGNRHSYDGTMELLLTSEIIVYGVGQGTSLASHKFGNRVARYANDTGGAVFYPIKTDSFAESCQRITQMARNQYVLGYTPTRLPEKPTYRKISVELIGARYKSLKIRSRKGYIAIRTY
jgi:Ca-activated chloride channel family protein